MKSMKKKWSLATLLVFSLVAVGLVFSGVRANADQPQASAGYICPATGEQLPCPSCCPVK